MVSLEKMLLRPPVLFILIIYGLPHIKTDRFKVSPPHPFFSRGYAERNMKFCQFSEFHSYLTYKWIQKELLCLLE